MSAERSGSVVRAQFSLEQVCLDFVFLKGQFILKSKTHIFPLTNGVTYYSRLLRCELSRVGDIDCRDICPHTKTIKLVVQI